MRTDVSFDPFGARDQFDTGHGTATLYRLSKLQDAGLGEIDRLPFSIRVLLESVLRNCDDFLVSQQDVKNLAAWKASAPAKQEVPFKPYRVVLQDFTGVPAVVDLAAMRSAMSRLGGDPEKINPLIPGRPRDRPQCPSRLFRQRRRVGKERRHGIQTQQRTLRIPSLGPTSV